MYAYRFSGKRYDCGSKLGYLQATVEYALGHPVLGADFRKYLIGISKSVAASPATRGKSPGSAKPVAKPRRKG